MRRRSAVSSPLVGEGREGGLGANIGQVSADTPLSISPPPQVGCSRLGQHHADLGNTRDPAGRGPDGAWPHLSGSLQGGRHLLPIRVYYEDTDFSGVVYHASYLRFMERGRTDVLRLAGIDQSALHRAGEGLVFAVRRMTIDFLRPARMDDVLMVETRTEEVRGASLVLAQRILRNGEILIMADVRVAALAGGRPARIPDALRAVLDPTRRPGK